MFVNNEAKGRILICNKNTVFCFDIMTHSDWISEKDLLESIKQGNTAAMKVLYDRYVEYLSAVCARYIPNEDDRRDILQESFIKIFTSIDRFELRDGSSFKAWLVRITVNESLRFLKKNAEYRNMECDETIPDTLDEPEIEHIPDDVINNMILSLAPGYRMVFNLYVYEEKIHKEISEILKIGVSSSASQFLRAKAQLAKMIKEYRKKHIDN